MPNAGRLEPGEQYIYERADGVIYARKLGAPPEERFAIGWDSAVQDKIDKFSRDILWSNILKEAEHNPTLQDALERVKVLYELSRQEQTIEHHPV